MKEYIMTFTVDELNLILTSLGKRTFEESAALIQKIHRIVKEQDQVVELGEDGNMDPM